MAYDVGEFAAPVGSGGHGARNGAQALEKIFGAVLGLMDKKVLEFKNPENMAALTAPKLSGWMEGALRRVLIVEDENAIRETIGDFLAESGYDVDTAANGAEARSKILAREFDLIITDLSMPIMGGFSLMKESIQIQPLTPVIILSGQGTFENAKRAIQMGAYDFVPKPVIDFAAFKISIDRALERKALMVARKHYQRELENTVAEQTKELNEKNKMLQGYTQQLEEVSVIVISSLQTALEEKDQYTAGHSIRVTRYAEGIGRQMGLDEHRLWVLSTAAKLHDLGKLMVDLGFMNKPGPLNDEEWAMMKKHPEVADRILAPFPFLEEVRPIIRHHHERFNGSGYPDGLYGEELDLLTQILAVADSFDAMTSHRSYRKTLPFEEAQEELRRCVDVLFSPRVVRALDEYLLIMGFDGE